MSVPSDMQNLTRKVIQRLEELGHDMDDVSESAVSSEPEDSEHEVDVDWEIPRKVLHSSIGFFTLYLYVSESPVHCVVRVLWSSLCVIYPADLLRFRYPSFAKLYEKILGFLMRDSEKNSTNGVIWYILGVNVALQFYPLDVATLSILILSWADTAASTIGRLYGSSSPRLPSNLYIPHRKFPLVKIPLSPRKSIAGFLAATLTGMIATVGFWGWIAPVRFSGRELSWDFVRGVAMSGVREGAGIKGLSGWTGLSVIGVVAGLVSGVTEAMDLGSLDDNLTLPIISGGCILGFLKFVGWVSSSWSRTF
ncbi:Diacylglycerol kinase [Leucoagaricus gongylophorus]